MRKYIRLLILSAALIAFTSCSISPEAEERPELNPVITSISAPSMTDVINNNSVDSPSITIMWNPVDKATFYVVEYLSALDYLAGDDYREFITQSNSFTLGSQYFMNSSDTRYVFRVKAASNTQTGSSIIYSPYSELDEGVIVNTFTVSPVIQDNVLNLYSSFPKIRSVLSDSSIVSPEVKYYDGDYADGSSLPEPLASSSIRLSSAEEKKITAVLSVDGKEVARKMVPAENSIDYYPPHLYSIGGSKNENGAITITWTAPDINKGLDKYNAELKFAIERQKDGGNWESLKDSSGNAIVLAAEDVLSGDSFTYSDTTADPNADYRYRVISEYFMTINGNDVVYAEDKQGVLETDICYTQDTMVKSFMITPVSGFEGEPVTSGDAEYEVLLEWESYHDLPDNLEYSVTRWDFDQITFINGSPTDSSPSVKFETVYTGSDKSFTDTFTISAEDNKKAYNYVYYIQLKEKDSSSSDYPMVQSKKIDEKGNFVDGIIKTNPSIKEVSFIKDGTLKATSGNDAYSDKIVISWSFDEDSIKAAGLSADKVSVHILKKTEDDSLYTDLFSKDDPGVAGTEFIDTDVEPGVAYNYMLRPYYNDSESLYNGAQATYSGITIGSTLKGVAGLSASMNTSNSEISVSWDKADYAHGYKVYYRKSGDSAWKEMESPIPADDASCTLTAADTIDPGTVYEITVGVIDASGSAKPDDSIAVKGSILGNITPEVTGKNNIKADSIIISWDKVENAASYKISIYDDAGKALAENKVLRINELTEVSGRYSYTFRADSDEFRAYAEAADDDGNLINEYPLSRKYKFSVMPVVKSGAQNIEPLDAPVITEGYWILPPKNITATKAEYRDLITISWNPIEDASGYVVYYRAHGSSDSWTYLNMVSGNVTYLDYLNNADKLDFTVSTIIGNQEGQAQSFFESDGNYGYPLIAPQRVSCVDLGNGFFRLSFNQVLGATDYVISFDDVQYDILTSAKADSAPSSLSDYADKAVEKSSSGVISYYIKRPDVKYRVSFNCSVAAKNSDAKIESKNTTSPVSTSVMYADISADDELRLALYNLNYIFRSVNSYFGNEWWPSSQNTLNDSGISASTCWGTSGFVTYNPANNGYIKLSNYSLFGNTITGNIICYVEKNQSSGYLGDDPLERISTDSNLVINLPGKYEDIIISFGEYYVNNSSGTVTINGKTVSLDKISPKLLEEI